MKRRPPGSMAYRATAGDGVIGGVGQSSESRGVLGAYLATSKRSLLALLLGVLGVGGLALWTLTSPALPLKAALLQETANGEGKFSPSSDGPATVRDGRRVAGVGRR